MSRHLVHIWLSPNVKVVVSFFADTGRCAVLNLFMALLSSFLNILLFGNCVVTFFFRKKHKDMLFVNLILPSIRRRLN